MCSPHSRATVVFRAPNSETLASPREHDFRARRFWRWSPPISETWPSTDSIEAPPSQEPATVKLPSEPPPSEPAASLVTPTPGAFAQRVSSATFLAAIAAIAALALAIGVMQARSSWRSLREIHPMAAELFESVRTRLSRAPASETAPLEPDPFVLVDARWIEPHEEHDHVLRERPEEAPPAVTSPAVAMRTPIRSGEHIFDDAL